jgi:hypothetical protein
MGFLLRGHSGVKIWCGARIWTGAIQFLAASDGPTIDQIAASNASISELRDIVAAKPGATQKPSSAIAPRHAIWINREIFISYVLISNILTT